jgi:hypothetical protein
MHAVFLGSYRRDASSVASAVLQSPPNARRRLRIPDPHLPKDLRLLHILDGFGG